MRRRAHPPAPALVCSPAAAVSLAATRATRRRGMFVVARAVARAEGVRALWNGVGPACLRVGGGAGASRQPRAQSLSSRAAAVGLYFLCLSKAHKAMEQSWPKDGEGRAVLPALRTFTLGAASRATAAFVFCPITVVKTRMVRGCAACARQSAS